MHGGVVIVTGHHGAMMLKHKIAQAAGQAVFVRQGDAIRHMLGDDGGGYFGVEVVVFIVEVPFVVAFMNTLCPIFGGSATLFLIGCVDLSRAL